MPELSGRLTVLVVEDDDDVLDGMNTVLTERGHRVLCARDGARALTLLANVRVDVILLDLTMPVMSGWEFLEAKVADPQLLDIPVIVVSASRDVMLDAERPPWAAIVHKPFAVSTLLREIERVTSGGRGTPPGSSRSTYGRHA